MRLPYRNIISNSQYAAFGCSHTWGVGVEAEEAWPYLLDAKNFGVSSCSADYIVRVAPRLIKKHNIKVIFVLWPDWTRFDYLQNGKYITSLPKDYNRIWYMETHPAEWLLQNFNNKVKELQQWCIKNHVKIINMTLYDLVPYIDHADKWPISKLGHHYSPLWHTWVAKIFKNSFDNNVVHGLRHD